MNGGDNKIRLSRRTVFISLLHIFACSAGKELFLSPHQMPVATNPEAPEQFVAPATQRLVSLDAFRGFTIAGMIFVIMVAGYRNLPQTFPAFGSAPVSTWKHAGEDFEPREWAHWDDDRTFQEAKVVQVLGNGRYDVALWAAKNGEGVYRSVPVRHSKPLEKGDDGIAVLPNTGGEPKFQGVGNG